VRIAEWLEGPLAGMLLSTLLGGLAVSLMGGVLSVLVVLKRMSFIGQGVSHSAFGGIGVAAVAGALMSSALPESTVFFIILAFCMVSALGMALSSSREALESDTAIGVFLVASMALGAALVALANRWGGGGGSAGSWERALFGTVIVVDRSFSVIAAAIAALVLGVAWWVRRPLVFWAFDEPASAAFGVRGTAMKLTLVMLLAVATVTAMRLAGIVYASALLVLPGAAALRLSCRMGTVVALAAGIAVLAMLLGLVASIELDLPSGATIVLALTLLFAFACILGGVLGRARRPGS
jgi:ABC-type Mn2+/Zn2+ transport system permease subunit